MAQAARKAKRKTGIAQPRFASFLIQPMCVNVPISAPL
jgi:hypothetical protein